MLQTVGNNWPEFLYKKLAFKTPRYKSIEFLGSGNIEVRLYFRIKYYCSSRPTLLFQFTVMDFILTLKFSLQWRFWFGSVFNVHPEMVQSNLEILDP